MKGGAGESAMVITVRSWVFRVVRMLGAREQENWKGIDGFLYLKNLIALRKSRIPTVDVDALRPEVRDVHSHRGHDNKHQAHSDLHRVLPSALMLTRTSQTDCHRERPSEHALALSDDVILIPELTTARRERNERLHLDFKVMGETVKY